MANLIQKLWSFNVGSIWFYIVLELDVFLGQIIDLVYRSLIILDQEVGMNCAPTTLKHNRGLPCRRHLDALDLKDRYLTFPIMDTLALYREDYLYLLV